MALTWMAKDLEGALITDPREKYLFDEARRIEDEKTELARNRDKDKRDRANRANKAFVETLTGKLTREMKRLKLPDEQKVWKAITAQVDDAFKGGARRAEVIAAAAGFVEHVATTRESQAKALVPTLTDEELEKMFPDQVKKIREGGRKKRVEKVKEKRKRKKAGAASRGRRKEKAEPWVSVHEAFE